MRDISKLECLFSYRDSIFKHKEWMVIGARFEFASALLALRSVFQSVKKYPPNLACPGSFLKMFCLNYLLPKFKQNRKVQSGRRKFLLAISAAVGACGMREEFT